MANEKNLVPFNQRSEAEARENGAKGGKASGEARRAKSKLKKILQEWANGTPSDDDIAQLEELGIKTKGVTRRALLLAPILKRAIIGDLKAVKMAIQLLNEDDKHNAEVGLLHAEIEKLKTENKLLLRKVKESDNPIPDEDNGVVIEIVGASDENQS